CATSKCFRTLPCSACPHSGGGRVQDRQRGDGYWSRSSRAYTTAVAAEARFPVGSGVAPASQRRPPIVLTYLALGLLVAIWLHRVWAIIQDSGLFRVLGIDWALYGAQSIIFRSGDAAGMYDLARMEAILQSYVSFT